MKRPDACGLDVTNSTLKNKIIMSKRILLVLVCSALVSTAFAQTTPPVPQEDPGRPKMIFEETEYNFGTIRQGESVTHIFKFTNTGKQPLIIDKAIGSCGCTIPEYPTEPIRPNGHGEIKVTFNSANKSGTQDKTVTITHNTEYTVALHMRGTVEVPAPSPAEKKDAPPAERPK